MASATRQVMTDAEIKGAVYRVLKKIAPEADLDALGPDDNLRQTLDIDSFDFLNFIIGLHDTLGVSIPEASYGEVKTLAGIMQYLSTQLR